MAATNFFLGANSGDGFQNLFNQFLTDRTMFDLMVLKGGPGSGKSTFMKQIGTAMEQCGLDVEYLWCSGDPDSLDGVLIPELHCGIADGTAPHVLEPEYPAAIQRYVNLGTFYDLTAAKNSSHEIVDMTKKNHQAYIRAYHSLKAARQVEMDIEAAAREKFDDYRANRRISGIIAREFRAHGSESGRTAYRFLGSITFRGYIWRFDSIAILCPRVYVLNDSYGLARELFQRLHAAAVKSGWNTIACLCPEDPGRIEHLLIPGMGLAFVTSRQGMNYGGKVYRRLRFDALTHMDNRPLQRFEIRMAGLLRDDAVAALDEAKMYHDKLESIYNPYVDFDGVRSLAALETSRLESWMERRRTSGKETAE